MSTHPDSAKVLDFLFASIGRKDQNALLQEFYSPEFVVFGQDPAIHGKSLTELLEAKPEKKQQIIENLRKVRCKQIHTLPSHWLRASVPSSLPSFQSR